MLADDELAEKTRETRRDSFRPSSTNEEMLDDGRSVLITSPSHLVAR